MVVDDKAPLFEARVVGNETAKRNTRYRHVVKAVGQFGFLEGLVADVRVGVKHPRQPGGDGINLDAGDDRAPVHGVRHEADEVAQTQRRFQEPAADEAEALQQGINRADDDRGGIMGVERRGPGRVEFVGREYPLQALALLGPLLVPYVEDLRQAAPADVAHQHALFVVRRLTRFGFESLEQLDGGKVLTALLFERTDAELVGFGEAIVALVAPRLWVGRNWLEEDIVACGRVRLQALASRQDSRGSRR